MINGPKEGWQYYFAYGSNMSTERIRRSLPLDKRRCPFATYIGIARLDGYRFIINDRKQFATIVADSAKTVYGVLWEIPDNEFEYLDLREGVNIGANKKSLIDVIFNDKIVKAVIYVDPTTTIDLSKKPDPGYMEHIINGLTEHGIDKTNPEYYSEVLSWR
jgi:gamma-glutamylcyclotransferase